ncbi:hypothetical protein KI387_006754, partial [Taxus chinensis]
QVLAVVKQKFNIKNWISDPCFILPWEGIQCTNISSAQLVRKESDMINTTCSYPVDRTHLH